MKDTFYFQHDYNTRTDIKIKRLIAKLGYRGYGVFWAIVEDLYNNANALPTDYESIAFDLREDSDFVKTVINDFELFVVDGNIFSSISIERRLEERNLRSEKARESAYIRWGKMPTHSEIDANALPTLSDSNAIKERKRKERKSNAEIEEEKIKAERFENFWKFYNKGSKKNAKVQFMKLSLEDIEKMRVHVVKYFKANPDKKFRKDAERYISHRLFDNEIEVQAEVLPEGWWNMDLTPEQMKLVPEHKLQEKKRHDVRRQMGI